jgi:hypothetical protein
MTPQKTTLISAPKGLQTRTARRAGAKSCSKNSSANSAMPQTVIALDARLDKLHHKGCETVAVPVTHDAPPEDARQRCSTGAACDSPMYPLEVTMERYIHDQNLAHYRRLVAESERDPLRNQVQHDWLLKLLADEEAESAKPQDRRH